KHVLNAQVSVRAPCCQKWKTMEMVFACKKCKKVFRKDMTAFEESDEYCPHCDNHYIIPAKTPQMGIGVEGEDARMVKDFRSKINKPEIDDLLTERMG
ncbi:hypothetical protein HK098_006725, partial [Nowakowskiella sp. JEL0407]